jgi:Fic family protein
MCCWRTVQKVRKEQEKEREEDRRENASQLRKHQSAPATRTEDLVRPRLVSRRDLRVTGKLFWDDRRVRPSNASTSAT